MSLIADLGRMESVIEGLKDQNSDEVDGFKGKKLVEVSELDRYRHDLEKYQSLSETQRVQLEDMNASMKSNMRDTSLYKTDKKAFQDNFEKLR
jgi:hypothetical protein